MNKLQNVNKINECMIKMKTLVLVCLILMSCFVKLILNLFLCLKEMYLHELNSFYNIGLFRCRNQQFCLIFLLFLLSRQEAAEDSSSFPVPMPRVKKRLSASFPEDVSQSANQLEVSGEANTEPTVPVRNKRRAAADAMDLQESFTAHTSPTSEIEVVGSTAFLLC